MPGLPGPILVLLGALLAAVPASSVSAGEASSQERPNQLQAVDFAPLPGGGVLVRLTFARQAQSPPGVLVDHYPIRRITFDFPDMLAVSGRQLIEIGPGGLRNIQVVPSGTRTRVILTLDRPFTFDTVLRGTILLITLRRQSWGIARGPGKWTDETDIAAPRHGLREVGFERGESGEGRIFELAGATDVLVFQFNRRLILTPHPEPENAGNASFDHAIGP